MSLRFICVAATALTLSAAASTPVYADATVKVSLWDKDGMEMDMSQNMGMGMGMHADMKMAKMGIEIDKASVPSGKVTFEVTNVAKELQHEMLVAPVSDENTVLPFVDAENRVDEEKSGDLGEVSELDPGKSGALTLDLKPGTYILFCNIPGHFMAGMWTLITVK